jgi:glycosyltransferase involved in cell wall biosynthesis
MPKRAVVPARITEPTRRLARRPGYHGGAVGERVGAPRSSSCQRRHVHDPRARTPKTRLAAPGVPGRTTAMTAGPVPSRPRRISFVTTGLGVGGAEAMLHRVVTRLDRDRFDPMIVSVMDDGEYGDAFRAAGIPVASIGFSNRVPTPARVARLIRTLRHQRPETIMGWMYHGNLAASLARPWAAPDASLAWNIRHSVYDLANERFLTRNLIRLGARLSDRVDATVYVSETSRRQHVGLGYAARSALVIGNGIDPAPVATPAQRAAVRSELGFGPGDIVVGHIARFHPMKDHATFLRAAILAIESEPTIRILLIGRDVNDANPALQPLLAAAGLAGRVVTLGERHDVPRLLAALDVFCQSSFSEGFPNAVLEAAVAGLPCVVTDVGASGEIAPEGELVVPARNVGALARALLDVVRLGPSGRARMGAAGRAHAIEHFSLDSVVERYAGLLDRLAAARRS